MTEKWTNDTLTGKSKMSESKPDFLSDDIQKVNLYLPRKFELLTLNGSKFQNLRE